MARSFLLVLICVGSAATAAEGDSEPSWSAAEVAERATQELEREGISLKQRGLVLHLVALEKGRWSVALEERAGGPGLEHPVLAAWPGCCADQLPIQRRRGPTPPTTPQT